MRRLFFITRYNPDMKRNRFFGLLWIGVSFIGLIASSWPVSQQEISIPFGSADSANGNMVLTIPSRLKVGDHSKIKLQVEFSSAKSTQTDIDKIDLISRLEFNSITITPNGESFFSSTPGKPILFTWDVQPLYEGNFSGIVWLFQQIPEQQNQLILGRTINLVSRTFLGISYKNARIFFSCGLIIGIILFMIFSIRKDKR